MLIMLLKLSCLYFLFFFSCTCETRFHLMLRSDTVKVRVSASFLSRLLPASLFFSPEKQRISPPATRVEMPPPTQHHFTPVK